MFQVNLVGLAHLTRLVLPGMLERGTGKVVNNASVSGYAFFPGASTYAASKAGVVAFTESLRRELRGTGVSTLHLVTPGVNTDMLDATEDAYGGHLDTSDWEKQEPEDGRQRWWRRSATTARCSARAARPPWPSWPHAVLACSSIASPTVSSAASRADSRERNGSLPRHSGLASTIWTSPIRHSRKPAST